MKENQQGRGNVIAA